MISRENELDSEPHKDCRSYFATFLDQEDAMTEAGYTLPKILREANGILVSWGSWELWTESSCNPTGLI